MLKVVLDTNQFVSAIISPYGASAKILEAWKNGEIILITSEDILKELGRVLGYQKIRKYHPFSDDEIHDFLEYLREQCIIVSGTLEARAVEDDPSDDKFIACAVEGEADYIVSGDKHLKAIRQYQGIQIVDPKLFLSIYKSF